MNNNTKDLMILSLGRVLQVLIGLVTLRLITEFLTEEQIGVYYILMTLLSLLAFGFFNPLGQFYGRHIIHWQQTGNLKTATITLLALRVIAIPLALLFAMILFYLLNYKKYFSPTEYAVFIIICLGALMHGVLLNATNVVVSRVTFTIYAVTTLSVGLVLSLVIIQFHQTATAWIYGLALSQIAFSFILYKIVVSNQILSIGKLKLVLRYKYLKGVFFFIFPATITLFLQWGQTASFRLVVENLYSVETLAFIAVGMALSGAIFTATESLATQFYMPIYLKKINNASQHVRALAWNELANIMLPIYISLAIYVIVCAPYMAKLLVAHKFQDAFKFAMVGAVVELLRVTTNLVYLVSQSEVKTINTIVPYLAGFVFMIFSFYTIDVSDSLWLVPTILAFSYLVTLAIMFHNMKKLLPIKIDVMELIKAIFVMMPLLAFYETNLQPDMSSALCIVSIGGGYFVIVQYKLLRNKFNKMIDTN